MKFKKLRSLTIAFAAGVLMMPAVGANADVDEDTANFYGYEWTNNSEYSSIVPPDINDAPGYIPFNGIFERTAGKHSQTLTNVNGSDVGVQLTKSGVVDTDPVTGKTIGQSEAIWNTAGNELNLNKNFHATMQFYLGDSSPSADGLAFVITGDKQTSIVGRGGTLGIWGAPETGDVTVGMSKSFAIAFDTYPGADKSDKAVYNVIQPSSTNPAKETGLAIKPRDGGAHKDDNFISYSYPGDYNQYAFVPDATGSQGRKNIVAYAGDGTNNYVRVNSNDNKNVGKGEGEFDFVKSGELYNGTWHQLDINYVADGNGGGTFTYNVTLRDPSGNTYADGNVSRSVTWNAADIQKYFGTYTPNWGFTSATGDFFEDSLVVFQNIPGLLANDMQAGLANSAQKPVTGSVYVGDVNESSYLVQYTPSDSKQSWPASESGTLSAILNAGTNYGYVVKTKADGTKYIPVNITYGDKSGTDYELEGVPDGDILEYKKSDGTMVEYATKVQVRGIHRFDQKGTATGQILNIDTIATQEGAAETVPAGSVGGDNGIITANIDLPATKVRPLSFDYAPSFTFPTLSVAQVIGGISNLAGTATSDATPAQNGIGMTLPGDAEYVLRASMDSFDLGPDYQAGNTSIKFDFNGTTRTLTDDGKQQTIFVGTKTPASTVSNVSLNMAPYPKIKKGTYGQSKNINWELDAVSPTPAAGSGN